MAFRILLVDDNREFLDTTERFLATDPAVVVAGRAHSGRGALEQLAHASVDLVVMDLVMPQMNGLEATRRIKAQPEAPAVVIVTLYDNPEYRTAAEAVGADGFIVKSDLGVHLLPLVNQLLVNQPAARVNA